MLSYNDYLKIQQLQNDNPDVYRIFNKLTTDMQKELSEINHFIKNQLAFLKTSYQFANDSHPEFNNIHNWSAMGNAIDDLDYYMERLSQLRYSARTLATELIDINNVLFEMPDYIDEFFETDCDYAYDLCKANPIISCNPNQLKLALSELIINAAEEDDTVSISTRTDGETVILSIMNTVTSICEDNTSLIDSDIDALCKPHFSTKEKHVGIGLAIVNHICLTYGIRLDMSFDDGTVSFNLFIPIMKM